MHRAKYDNPKYQVEQPDREFDPEDRTLVVMCTFVPKPVTAEYNTRSYIDHECTLYRHNRLECLKFTLACYDHYNPGADYDLIIVDNGTQNVQAIELFRSLDIPVYTRENRYYSFGAYRYAYENFGEPYKYFVFHEMDWVPSHNGWLKNLQDRWIANPDVGMLGNLVEGRGFSDKPEHDNQIVSNAFIQKISPHRHTQYNLDSEYLFMDHIVIEQMLDHGGWQIYDCTPYTSLPATYNELAFQQPMLEMGYSIMGYDDDKHTMMYGIYNAHFPPRWNHGWSSMAPFLPEQSRLFCPAARAYFDFYNHDQNTSLEWIESALVT